MTGIFSKPSAPTIIQQAPPPVPAPTPVATLPTVDDATIAQDRALKQAQTLQRSGRKSTILTSPQTRSSGGDSYSSGNFGG
jgi:hypothetical protein